MHIPPGFRPQSGSSSRPVASVLCWVQRQDRRQELTSQRSRLFSCRALKTKHETPKYGLIYHASLIGQSQPKYKGKISRVLAAKCALAIRVDALGDTTDASVGLEAREKVSRSSKSRQQSAARRILPVLALQTFAMPARGRRAPSSCLISFAEEGSRSSLTLGVRLSLTRGTHTNCVTEKLCVQVEARLRQLEGRSLASDAAKPKGKQQPAAYSAAAQQAGGGSLLAGSGAKAYNAAADIVPVSFHACLQTVACGAATCRRATSERLGSSASMLRG